MSEKTGENVQSQRGLWIRFTEPSRVETSSLLTWKNVRNTGYTSEQKPGPDVL